MRMFDLIGKKKYGEKLTKEEIDWFITGYVAGNIPDYQVSALLMAIWFNGMTKEETFALANAMLHSGDVMDLSSVEGFQVDKHSTGGVGDKVSIPLAPLVASVDGIKNPMVSGRGLGHTGGTLDKLESIEGFTVDMTEEQFRKQLEKVGCVICSASENIAPADKKIYALRDVTNTINSIPLISASIMSKKIASGTDALVLDVKTGSGAFMQKEEDSKALARMLVDIAQAAGKQCMAYITDMNQPLGNKIGNALEIEESIDILNNKGPEDLRELVLLQGAEMLFMSGKYNSREEARAVLEKNLANGKALEKFKEMVAAQGGNTAVIDNSSLLPQAAYKKEVKAQKDGVVASMQADQLGIASMLLGGGRATKDDKLDFAVGLELHKKVGDKVQTGDTLVTVYANQEDTKEVEDLILSTIEIGEDAQTFPLVHATVE